MPAPADPRNTIEVTVPPVLGQDQKFEFTFRPACPGPVTVKISMGLHLSSDSSPVPNLTRKLSTPPAPRVSVGISPIRAQHTPLRMLVSRGCSPVPMISLLPPDIAAFFNSTQMQLTQDSESSVALPVHLGVSDVISVTSSESDNEATQNPSSSRVPRDRPGDSGSELFHKDFLSAPTLGKAGELMRKRRKVYRAQ